MRTNAINKRLPDLVVLLGDIGALYRDLLQKVRDKADAMRQGDVQAIQACTKKEHDLVDRIQRREGLRLETQLQIRHSPSRLAAEMVASGVTQKLSVAPHHGHWRRPER